MKRIIEKLREAFNENNIGVTICFILFLGPLAYLFLKHTPLGSILMTAGIGYCCYAWGYMKGINSERKKQEEENIK